MGVEWVTAGGASGTITVVRRDDAWYLAEPDRDVQCLVTGDGEPDPGDGPHELVGTVSKYVWSTTSAPDFLFFETGSIVTGSTERETDPGRSTDTDSAETGSATTYPERRLTDLSGSGDYVTVEAVVDSIEWVRKGEQNVPDVLGTLRDERSGDVLPFVVSDGIRHPYLEAGTVFEFTGIRDHYNGRRDQIQVLITERTAFEELGTTTSKTPRTSASSENSTSSTGDELDSIARSMIGKRVFTESREDRDSAVGKAKRRARKQGRDPAIDPRFR